MPSPFPGMDPYLEGEEWSDFHATFNTVIREVLLPRVRPRYTVKVDRRVFTDVTDGDGGPVQRAQRVPDDLVLRNQEVGGAPLGPVAGGAAALATLSVPLAEPVPAVLPARPGVERRETFVEVRSLPGREVVAVIETLSPANKRPGTGREAYLRKREEVLDGAAHLVEIDLLRGGERPPVGGTLPASAFRVLVSCAADRPRCGVFPFGLADPLPTVPVPLKPEDGIVPLELQRVMGLVYDRAFYGDTLDYTTGPAPPFTPAEAAFARTLPGVLGNGD